MEVNQVRTFVCAEVPKRCFLSFEIMRKRKELCDVTFRVGNESISAHRIIVTAVIPYFREVLLSTDAEMGISIPDIDPNAFKCLVEFAYSCQVTIDMQNVTSLLSTASYLGVEEVRKACCDFLADNLEPGNVLSIREFARNLDCCDLLKTIDSYVKANFLELAHTKYFINFPLPYVKEIIDQDDLNVDAEEKVFEVVMKYVKVYPQERIPKLPELLCKIRMPLLQPLYLTNIVEREEMIRKSMLCRDLIDEAKNYNLFPQMRKRICSFPTKPRQFIQTTPVKHDSGRITIYKLEAKVNHTVQHFDLSEQIWHKKKSKAFYENRGSAVAVRNKMYYFIWGDTLQFDPANNTYKYLSNMPIPRVAVGVATVRSKIYVCGGRVGHYASNVVECFDPKKDEWKKVRSMTVARWGTSVVALGKYIFVLGGEDSSGLYDYMERYDTMMDTWKVMPSMYAKRSFAGAATVNGKIYICGGKTLPTGTKDVLATAEVYDPVSNSWGFISSMVNARYEFTLLPCRGSLIAVGGESGNGDVYNFEIYDPENDKWTCGPSTDSSCYASGSVILASSE